MTRLYRCLAAFLLLAGLTASARTADETLPSSSSWYPIKPGNTWHYRAGENRFQLKVTKIEKVAGTPCARLELIVDGKTISHEHISVAKDALVRFSYEGKEAKPPIKFLELPPKKGASWKVESRIDGQPLKGTFKTDELDVKVPAGSYKAFSVSGQDLEANGVKLSLTYYFAERVGLVKEVVEMAGQKINIELEKFEEGK